MKPVYAVATNITSAMGLDTAANWKAVAGGKPGVKRYEDASLSNTPFWASKLDPAQWQVIAAQTKGNDVLSPFEQMIVFSVKQALQNIPYTLDPQKTVLILSSTKGNIEWLNNTADERTMLYQSAEMVKQHLGIADKALVVSHACVSGVIALQYAHSLLNANRYEHAIVVGCDRFSQFVLSGFQSFQAIADGPCRPFDAARTGINLGEAAATIILSATPGDMPMAALLSGATSNDANHISGPSRTGEELALAIDRALNIAGINADDINMVSAHGTATMYNDEMEAKAFALSNLLHAGVHSMKSFVGHTLGAAGILESAMIIESIQQQKMIPSANYISNGVSAELNITQEMEPAAINYVLKTASGFGGCNATAIWGKP